jgi:hypothetical protein
MFLEAFTKNWKSALVGGVFRMMNLEFMFAGQPSPPWRVAKNPSPSGQ